MNRAGAPIVFAGCQTEKTHRHCAFLKSADEAASVLPPIAIDGFQCGEMADRRVSPVAGGAPSIPSNSSQKFA